METGLSAERSEVVVPVTAPVTLKVRALSIASAEEATTLTVPLELVILLTLRSAKSSPFFSSILESAEDH